MFNDRDSQDSITIIFRRNGDLYELEEIIVPGETKCELKVDNNLLRFGVEI